MSGAGMIAAKADLPRGLLAQIQLKNEEAAEVAAENNKSDTTDVKKQEGPVKAMTKEEEQAWKDYGASMRRRATNH